MTLEMGKRISESRAEIEKCAWLCRHYATHAQKYLQDQLIETDAKKSYLCYRPLGVILGVMPWNFPFWQVFRFCIPAIMAGNTTVLKHASQVLGCAIRIESLFKEAGFPSHVFQSLLIPASMVSKVIAHDEIMAVSLTGSLNAGSAVSSVAGKFIKKVRPWSWVGMTHTWYWKMQT